MLKACIVWAFFCLVLALPLRAFDWETANSNGREYVSLRSFCQFYGFGYSAPSGNDRFFARNSGHSVSFKIGSSDAYIDGVHYVLSFPIEGGDRDWLVSRMDVIKLFEPIIRPTEISGRHTIRGVVIDAGHGGSDNGAGSRLGNEKTYTLDTANRLARILNDAGLKTVFTRRTDTFVDLYERAHIASLYSDYAFVSIHYNSASEEARGLETYCLSPRGAASTSSRYLMRGDIQKLPGNDDDTQNILLASSVHSEIIKLNPGDATADRGVKRARFVVIKATTIPAILVEGGFVSNHMEAARVNQPNYRQNLAQAIARGVIRFVNVMGDRHMSLPGVSPDQGSPAPAPKAVAVTPAPSGATAKTPSGKTPAANAPAPASTTPVSIHKSKRDKNKKTAAAPDNSKTPATPAPSPAPAASTNSVATVDAPAKTDAPAKSDVPAKSDDSSKSASTNSASATAPGKALNLNEPTPPPAPSPGADKAPAEPDEPPTVNIYGAPPAPAPSSASSSASTNATSKPAPPPEKEP